MSDDRGADLGERFSSITEAGEETDETDEVNNTDKAYNTPQTTKKTESEETPVDPRERETPIRERTQKMLYLEEEFVDELELAYKTIALRIEREHGIEIEKNRHFYPALLAIARDELGDVQERDLDELTELLGINTE